MPQLVKETIEKARAGERVRIGKRQLEDVIWAAKALGAAEAKERYQLEPLETLEGSFRLWAERRAAKKTFEDDLFARAYIEALGLVSEFISMAKRPDSEPMDDDAESIRAQVRKVEYDRLLEGGRRWVYLQQQLRDLLTAEEMELLTLYRQSDEQRGGYILDYARVCADATLAGVETTAPPASEA